MCRKERGMLSLKVQETFRVQFDLGFKGAIRCPGLLGSVYYHVFHERRVRRRQRKKPGKGEGERQR